MNIEVGINALRTKIWQVIGILKFLLNKRRFENNFQKLMAKAIN